MQELISELSADLSVAEYDKLRSEIPTDLERSIALLKAGNAVKILSVKSPPHSFDTEPERDQLDERIADLSYQLVSVCGQLRFLELEMYFVDFERLLSALQASGARPERISLRTVEGVDLTGLASLSDLYPDIRRLEIDCWLPPRGNSEELRSRAQSGILFPRLTSLTFPAMTEWSAIWRAHASIQEMAVVWGDSEEDPTQILSSASDDMQMALQRCLSMTPSGVGTNLVFLCGQRPWLVADTLLTDAVRSCDEAGVLTLIANGIDANRRFSSMGIALPLALHVAIESEHLSMVNLLLDSGASLTLRNNGCTALYSAFLSANGEIKEKIFTTEILQKCSGGTSVVPAVIDSLLRSSDTCVHALGSESWIDNTPGETADVLKWATTEPRRSWFDLIPEDPSFAEKLIDFEGRTPAHRCGANLAFAIYDLGINARQKDYQGLTPIEYNTSEGAAPVLLMWYVANCQISKVVAPGNLVPGTPEYASVLQTCAITIGNRSSDYVEYAETLIASAELSDLVREVLLYQFWVGGRWQLILQMGKAISAMISDASSGQHEVELQDFFSVVQQNLEEERAFEEDTSQFSTLSSIAGVFSEAAAKAGIPFRLGYTPTAAQASLDEEPAFKRRKIE